jgi:hypothetical protein
VIQFGPVSAGTSPLVCCEAISETLTGWPVKRVIALSQLSQLKKEKCLIPFFNPPVAD